jgi:peptide/nickel transport system permease protein
MGLIEYVARRCILLIPVLLGAILLVFAVTQMIPIRSRAMLFIESEKQLKNLDQIIQRYGLNSSVFDQFTNWITQLSQGNWGYSEYFQEQINKGFSARYPATLEIVIFSAPIIIFVGIYLGVQAAVHKDGLIDQVTRFTSIIGSSLPSFWLGLLLLAIFGGLLGWTTSGRVSSEAQTFINLAQLTEVKFGPYQGKWHPYTGLYIIDSLLNGQYGIFIDTVRHLILPIVVLTVINSATLIRVMRSSMLESMSKLYVIAATARGLKKKEVINKHARRTALIPIMTMSGLMVGGMMTGLTITETVFNFGGIGNYAAMAALHYDIPIVLIYTLFTGIIFVLSNLIIDILYAYIDPRIRLG